jgi:hypothetical protein
MRALRQHFVLDLPPLQGQNVILGRYSKNQITYLVFVTHILKLGNVAYLAAPPQMRSEKLYRGDAS